jgi:MFS family permease
VALSNLAMYVTLLALPVLLSRREGWTSTGIGIAVAPAAFPFGAFALSPPGGRLSDRLGSPAPRRPRGWA